MNSAATFELKQFHDVLADEHSRINQRRESLKRPVLSDIPPLQPELRELRKQYASSRVHETVGLAFSGGGIRSAAICLGAAQALGAYRVIDRVDYLSTVSGGGYAGTAITSSMSKSKEFPFRNIGDRSDPEALKHIRDFSNYLVPHGWRDVLINIAVYLRGIFANGLFVLPVLLLFAAFTVWVNPAVKDLSVAGFHDWPRLNAYLLSDGPFGMTLTLALLVAGWYCLWAIICSIGKAGPDAGGWLSTAGYYCLIALAALAFCEFQPFFLGLMISPHTPGAGTASTTAFAAHLNSTVKQLSDSLTAISAAIAPVLAAVSFISKYLGDALKQTSGDKNSWAGLAAKLTSKLIVWAAALALPLLLWVVYLLLILWGVKPDAPLYGPAPPPNFAPEWFQTVASKLGQLRIDGLPEYASAYVVAGVPMMVLWLLLKPNANSLHRLYRDRLSKAFVFEMKDNKAEACDGKKLTAVDTANTPYPLYNMALNVQGSHKVNRRGRNADFFIMSPRYCGSEVIGYAETGKLEGAEPALDLATAMAISGAAISSNMGSESIKPLAPTLALLNFRLGYWLRNPNPNYASPANRLVRNLYLLTEIFSRADETSSEIYLTDGGHIENLGVYELLRRRCRLIIAVDAEADPELNFPSFVRLQRYARIDFGIRIDMKWDKLRKTALAAQNGNVAAAAGPHCAIGRIDYSETETGILVYIKSSVTGDENDYIADYNRRYRLFPHETTGDQFFSEEQFEVYRALGFHMVKGLFMGDQKVQTLDQDLEFFASNAKGWGVAEAARYLGVENRF